MRSILALALCFLVCVAGCESAPPKAGVFPVAGKVTVGGKPLSGYRIVLMPAGGGEGAHATIGEDGSYKLVSLDGREGCPAGKYKVVFQVSPEAAQKAMMNMQPGAGGPPAVEAPFPKEYSDVPTSPKEVEVQAKPNTIDITL